MSRSSKLIFVAFMLTALALASPGFVSAQTDPVNFHVSFGADVNPGSYPWYDYEFDRGVVNSEQGDPVPAANGEFDRIDAFGTTMEQVEIRVYLPDDCILTDVQWQYTYQWPGPFTPGITHNASINDAGGGALVGMTADIGSKGVWHNNTPWSGEITGADYIWIVLETGTEFEGVDGGYVALDNIEFTCEGIDPPDPPEDEGPFQPIVESAQIDIFPAIEEGEDPISASRISAILNGPPLFPGAVPVYASIGGTVENVVQTGGGYSLQIVNEDDNLTATYANLSRVYVEPGASVAAGCVIGLAGPQFASIDTDETGEIFQIIFSLNDDFFDDLVDWTEFESPAGDTLCSTSDDNCINKNARFADGPEFWTPINGELNTATTISAGSAILPPGGSIRQYLVLPSTGEFGVTIALQADDGPTYAVNDGEVTARLGDALVTENFTNQQSMVKLLDIGPLDPTAPTVAPDVYELRITNAESRSDQINRPSSLRIAFVCLYDWDGGSTPPATCYFPDPGFDDGGGWILEDGAEIGTIATPFEDADNYLALPDTGAKASTSFSLSGYEDEDTLYRMTLWGNSAILDAPLGVGELTVDFDADDPEGDVTYLNIVDGSWFSWSRESFTYTVPAGTTYTGTFTIENTTGDLYYIGIDNVCLEPANGEWPDYEGTTPPGAIPIVPESCVIIPRAPVSAEVNMWVAWVGALIRYFWTCQAPIWVAQILASLDAIQDWLAMLGRWLMVVFSLLWQLMWSTTQWGVYTLYNLIAGLVEEIWSVSSGAITLPWNGFSLLLMLLWTAFIAVISLTWTLLMGLVSLAWALFIALFTLLWNTFSALMVALWVAITSLPLINLFALGGVITELLFTIIAQVLSLIVTAFGVLATMAQIVGVFFSSIQAGFNGTSSADLGVVNCATMLSDDPMYPFCMGIDVTEYAINAFPAFQILGFALMGAMAYHTLRITIDWYRRAFEEAS